MTDDPLSEPAVAPVHIHAHALPDPEDMVAEIDEGTRGDPHLRHAPMLRPLSPSFTVLRRKSRNSLSPSLTRRATTALSDGMASFSLGVLGYDNRRLDVVIQSLPERGSLFHASFGSSTVATYIDLVADATDPGLEQIDQGATGGFRDTTTIVLIACPLHRAPHRFPPPGQPMNLRSHATSTPASHHPIQPRTQSTT